MARLCHIGAIGRTVSLCILSTLVVMQTSAQAPGSWRPAEGRLATRWAADVSPDNVLPEYPRPQMVRPDWLNLNGLWAYAVVPAGAERPTAYDGEILVPFPIESSLSGVMRRVDPESRLWYRRTVDLPAAWEGRRVLLHFGAVDWEATVWVNGREVGQHRGGYDPFTFDITDALQPGGPQEVLVAVTDPTDTGTQPRGKQVREPEGIWYTPTTGIWQTVWLEPVPDVAIGRLEMRPTLDDGHAAGRLHLSVDVPAAAAAYEVEAVARDGDWIVASANGPAGRPLELVIPEPNLWSPESPFLYDLQVRLHRDGQTIDEVESYFGMREVGLGTDERGIRRLTLNGAPIFHFGPLDQGFWPDGLYTAPTDEALRYDIEVTKQLGFNMARKHVKVEPARWYYWADRLGLLVWQDMPSGDAFVGEDEDEITRSEASALQFERELRGLIDAFYNHPSIVMWVLFNEGWGQYDTERLAQWAEQYDPTRLINSVSGWTDFGAGHVHDIHSYPGPNAPPAEPDRAVVLGEYGGLGLPLAGHTWQDQENWGYRSYEDQATLERAYLDLLDSMKPLLHEPGLAAAVYTQTTDVEVEVNGLVTYDRAVVKVDSARIGAANRALIERMRQPAPRFEVLVPTSEKAPQAWRYTTTPPADGWEQAAFDDAAWQEGPAGFGNDVDAPVHTPWTTPDLWMRKSFEMPPSENAVTYLRIYHDGDAQVYLNGHRIDASGWSNGYRLIRLDAAAKAALQSGTNTVAVHVHNNSGGQFIDVGLFNMIEE